MALVPRLERFDNEWPRRGSLIVQLAGWASRTAALTSSLGQHERYDFHFTTSKIAPKEQFECAATI